MQGLSLWQPWAQLIATGHKTIETRSRPPPGARVGQRIAIHATLHKARPKDFTDEEQHELLALLDLAWHRRIPYGAFVCTALLEGAQRVLEDQSNIPLRAGRGTHERMWGDYAPGRWMWMLADVRPIPQPIRYRGARRLFEIEGPAAVELASFEASWWRKPPTTITGNARDRAICVDGKNLPIAPSLKLRNHSPTGFMWGYGGSGPAQAALAILMLYLPDREALGAYQQFKFDIISNLDGDFTLEGANVQNWIEHNRASHDQE